MHREQRHKCGGIHTQKLKKKSPQIVRPCSGTCLSNFQVLWSSNIVEANKMFILLVIFFHNI